MSSPAVGQVYVDRDKRMNRHGLVKRVDETHVYMARCAADGRDLDPKNQKLIRISRRSLFGQANGWSLVSDVH